MTQRSSRQDEEDTTREDTTKAGGVLERLKTKGRDALMARIARVREAWERRRAGLGDRIIDALDRGWEALRPSELRRRALAARKWAVEHDTVSNETIARQRERFLDREQRHEQRDVDRQHRHEEHEKIREKHHEEERQTYSVYFE